MPDKQVKKAPKSELVMPAIPEEIEESERKVSEENDCPMCAKLIRSKCLLCKIDVTKEY